MLLQVCHLCHSLPHDEAEHDLSAGHFCSCPCLCFLHPAPAPTPLAAALCLWFLLLAIAPCSYVLPPSPAPPHCHLSLLLALTPAPPGTGGDLPGQESAAQPWLPPATLRAGAHAQVTPERPAILPIDHNLIKIFYQLLW